MRQHRGERPRRHLPGALVAVLAVLAVLVPVLPPRGAALPAATADSREAHSEVLFRQARQFALRQLARTDRRLRDGRFPTVAPGQRWHTSGTNGWLAGFFPGQ
ncbi:MAG TPA: hypothetical protein VFV76_03685, partial [Actinomycetes bacterium]|nr:hypothetical protein [Actinomycetes bacterium]